MSAILYQLHGVQEFTTATHIVMCTDIKCINLACKEVATRKRTFFWKLMKICFIPVTTVKAYSSILNKNHPTVKKRFLYTRDNNRSRSDHLYVHILRSNTTNFPFYTSKIVRMWLLFKGHSSLNNNHILANLVISTLRTAKYNKKKNNSIEQMTWHI